MTILFENVLFLDNAPSATTKRTPADRWGNIVNVKSYGALGDGIADDAAAIQRAFDAAFGPASSPHGNPANPINNSVYFPRGSYKILSTVKVTAVWGGRIFGDGQKVSGINFAGSITPCNPGGTGGDQFWCPTLWINGANYITIEQLSFNNVSDPTNHSTVCLWWGPDGANGGSSSHTNMVIHCETSNASYGVIHGSTNSQANSENTYINCNIHDHEQVGFFASGQNSLNLRLYGGTIGFCGTGIKMNNGATIPIISNCATDHNPLDIDLSTSSTAIISGVRTESPAFLKTSSNQTIVQACTQAQGGGTFTGSTNGAFPLGGPAATFNGTLAAGILTVNSISQGAIVSGIKIYGAGVTAQTTIVSPVVGGGNTKWNVTGSQSIGPIAMTAGTILLVTVFGTAPGVGDGQIIYGSDGTNSLPHSFAGGQSFATRLVANLTGTGGGGTYVLSDQGTPGNLASATLTCRPVFFEIIGSGGIFSEQSGGEFDSVIKADNNSTLNLYQHQITDQAHGGISADLFTFSQGIMLAYDTSNFSNFTVATLPTPNVGWKGCRMFVTDASVTGSTSTNYGTIVAGSGANTVPVWCDGTNWRIG